MATCKMVSCEPRQDGGMALCFQNVDPQTLADDVSTFFKGLGYKFEGGTPTSGTWGQGSEILRILFGAFVKRYKFQANIEQQPPHVWLKVSKAMSGAMGGVIGYARMNKEATRISGLLQQFFT